MYSFLTDSAPDPAAQNDSFWWIPLAVALSALSGVVIGHIVSVLTERSKRRFEQIKETRDHAEVLSNGLYDFCSEVLSSRGVRKANPDPDGIYEELWQQTSPSLIQHAAMVGGTKGHRQAIQALLSGLNNARPLADFGEGVSGTLRQDYAAMSRSAYEVATAWLRHEPISKYEKRLVRKVNKGLYWLALEEQDRHHELTHGIRQKSGLLRRAGRKVSRWIRKETKSLVEPFRRCWDYLMRP